MEELKCTIDKVNRPGGFIITERAILYCALQKGARLLDIGCGSGATVNYLQEKYGFEAFGIDIDLQNQQTNLIKATAKQIPFTDTSMDGVIMECSLSLMQDQNAVLHECLRVLKPNGRLIISDMYARGESAKFDGCLGNLDSKEILISLVENNGFKVELFEDYTHHLQTMWGQMIMDKGAQAFYCNLGVSPDEMKRIKCGYCLIIATKISV